MQRNNLKNLFDSLTKFNPIDLNDFAFLDVDDEMNLKSNSKNELKNEIKVNEKKQTKKMKGNKNENKQ